jgi:hypothetical protein
MTATIAAMRKEDMPEPWVPSGEETCVVCGRTVWVSHATKSGVEGLKGKNFQIACMQCASEDASRR